MDENFSSTILYLDPCAGLYRMYQKYLFLYFDMACLVVDGPRFTHTHKLKGMRNGSRMAYWAVQGLPNHRSRFLLPQQCFWITIGKISIASLGEMRSSFLSQFKMHLFQPPEWRGNHTLSRLTRLWSLLGEKVRVYLLPPQFRKPVWDFVGSWAMSWDLKADPDCTTAFSSNWQDPPASLPWASVTHLCVWYVHLQWHWLCVDNHLLYTKLRVVGTSLGITPPPPPHILGHAPKPETPLLCCGSGPGFQPFPGGCIFVCNDIRNLNFKAESDDFCSKLEQP